MLRDRNGGGQQAQDLYSSFTFPSKKDFSVNLILVDLIK